MQNIFYYIMIHTNQISNELLICHTFITYECLKFRFTYSGVAKADFRRIICLLIILFI